MSRQMSGQMSLICPSAYSYKVTILYISNYFYKYSYIDTILKGITYIKNR